MKKSGLRCMAGTCIEFLYCSTRLLTLAFLASVLHSTEPGPAPLLGVLPVPVHHQTPQHARQRSGPLEGVGQVGGVVLLAQEKVAFDLKKMGSLDKQQEHWIISYSRLMSLCAMYTHQQSCRLTQPYLSINHDASIPALISYVLKACTHLQLHACIYHMCGIGISAFKLSLQPSC